MKTLTVQFVKLEQTEYGLQAVFASKAKGEWKPKPIKQGLDLSKLEAGKYYQVTFDDEHYWMVVAVKEAASAFSPRGDGVRVYDNKQFVSNVVGSAIQAGKITGPEDIDAWARAAWKTVGTLEAPSESSQPASEPARSAPPEALECPRCGHQTVRKSKFKDEWYCFYIDRETGEKCATRYAKDAPEIVGQLDGEIPQLPREMGEDPPF